MLPAPTLMLPPQPPSDDVNPIPNMEPHETSPVTPSSSPTSHITPPVVSTPTQQWTPTPQPTQLHPMVAEASVTPVYIMFDNFIDIVVVKYWAEKGVSGFYVYKFRLKRMEGQPSLVTDMANLLFLMLG
ncbi:unnamed protein product [Lactuca saligna]|uniref:Uncharacterized protein n=1 Tax=Lactuca saligna TaxID=75948 RepID=A0AA35Z416_LACSI|nr:unnamed protein product [Lactuca saligna]